MLLSVGVLVRVVMRMVVLVEDGGVVTTMTAIVRSTDQP